VSRHLAGPPSSVWDISQLQHSNVYRSGNPPNRGDDVIGVGRLQEVVNGPEKNRQLPARFFVLRCRGVARRKEAMGDEIMKTTKGTRMTAPTQDATFRLKHELMNDALRGVSPGRVARHVATFREIRAGSQKTGRP
jgi:hypothetical protein